MFMRDDPAATLLAQSDGQAKAVLGILPELLVSPATEQRMREGHVVACGNVKRNDFEHGALFLPVEERRPRLAISLDTPHAVVGGGTSNITMSSA
jgi:hypothetical protein